MLKRLMLALLSLQRVRNWWLLVPTSFLVTISFKMFRTLNCIKSFQTRVSLVFLLLLLLHPIPYFFPLPYHTSYVYILISLRPSFLVVLAAYKKALAINEHHQITNTASSVASTVSSVANSALKAV